jgi:hypothetical protein
MLSHMVDDRYLQIKEKAPYAVVGDPFPVGANGANAKEKLS